MNEFKCRKCERECGLIMFDKLMTKPICCYCIKNEKLTSKEIFDVSCGTCKSVHNVFTNKVMKKPVCRDCIGKLTVKEIFDDKYIDSTILKIEQNDKMIFS